MFCNTKLPDYEVTLIRPPIGDPAFQDNEYWILKKTLIGLRWSPHHWYNTIKGILLKMGLNKSLHEPCILSGVITNPSSPAFISDLQSQLHAGIYVNDFVFYSSDPAQEELFKTLSRGFISMLRIAEKVVIPQRHQHIPIENLFTLWSSQQLLWYSGWSKSQS